MSGAQDASASANGALPFRESEHQSASASTSTIPTEESLALNGQIDNLVIDSNSDDDDDDNDDDGGNQYLIADDDISSAQALRRPELTESVAVDVLQPAADYATSSGDDDELARFRRDWAEEVRRRKDVESVVQSGKDKASSEASRDGAISSNRESVRQNDGDEAPMQTAASTAPSNSSDGPRHSDYKSSIRDRMRPVSKSDMATRRPLASLADQMSMTSQDAGTSRVTPSLGQATAQEDVEPSGLESETTSPHIPIRLMRRAVVTYAKAVAAERKGDLDDALQQYRKAFRLDAEADKLFDRASKAIQVQDTSSRSTAPRREMLLEGDGVLEAVCAALDVDDHRFTAIQELNWRSRQFKEGDAPPSPDSKSRLAAEMCDGKASPQSALAFADERVRPPTKVGNRGGDHLTRLLQGLSRESGGLRDFSQVQFMREDEELDLGIAKLPDELLLHILALVAAPKGSRGAEIRKPTAATLPPASVQQPTGLRKEAQALQTPSDANAPAALASKAQAQSHGIGIVLAGPDYMSIEQLGRVCWKFRLLTRAWSVWKLIVNETYYPPQIDPQTRLPSLLERHDDDWRTTFVDQPRVRLNGAYIAAHHYTRPGVHEENVWVRVVHVVEFYRTLRFLPDGRLLSLLTTDPPNETVRRMEPSLRIKGFAIGQWRLFADGLDDDDACGRPLGPKIIIDDLHDKTLAGYTFRMVLKLDKTSRGKWNRMEMLEFESVNLRTGEVCPLPMNHKKPFHFSTVRSYGI